MLKLQLVIASLAFQQSLVTSQYTEIGSEGNSKIGKPAIGGNVASLGDLPHAAVVIGKTGKCTASIIHQSWVLTAAHCVSDLRGKPVQSSDVQVMAGVIDFKSPGTSAQKRQGLKIIIHQGYVPQDIGKFDIALVKVEPFQLNNYVKVIGFASKEWPQDRRMLNRTCTSSGWGMLANRETTSVLHSQRTIAKHGLDSCPCIHKGYILKRIICLAAESTVGICFGDSGGALICDGEIVGVAHMVMDKRSCSYFKSPESTIYCESAYVFGMYIFTCPLLNWIREYVPGVPPTPASCKANISTPIFSLISLLILFFIVKN